MYCKYMNVSTHLEPDENIYKVCMQLHVVEPNCKMMNQIDFVFFFTWWEVHYMYSFTQGNYATVGSAIVAIAIVGTGGWAGLSSTVAI